MLTPSRDGISIEHVPVDYDAGAASADMTAAGLPEEYANTLTNGLWDNCDILPENETRQQGKALEFEPVIWPRLLDAAE